MPQRYKPRPKVIGYLFLETIFKKFFLTWHGRRLGHVNWQYIHIIIIVTWSGVLYHVEWMRSYHRIQWYGLIHETWYCTPDQVTIMIICLLWPFFLTFFLILEPVLVFNPEKNAGMFAITLRFLMSRHHVFRLWFHAWNLLYVTSPQKQVTDVSLVLKDSDIDSENLISLIWLSVSDGQKT